VHLLTPHRRLNMLTGRERSVLAYLAEGFTVEQIARLESIGTTTVRSHVRSIFMKLGVNTQHAAVALVYRAHWPTDQPSMTDLLMA
jgi:DNA-binding CsgD family transcriptional regulator